MMREAERRGWGLLAVLIAAYVCSFLDRQIVSILVEPLKRDLRLSDTQIGLLQGLAFAIALSLAGLPLGRLIDRGPRLVIVSVGVAMWSLMTMSSALAGGFSALLVCRMGVAIGEAVLTPAAHALIADSFPPRRLGLALGLYGAGAFLGMGLAYAAGAAVLAALEARGGGLGGLRPWQAVFVAVGAPGLVIAAGIMLLREPVRPAGVSPRIATSLAEAARFFASRWRAIAAVDLCLAFAAMSAYAVSAWAPSLLIRAYGWSAGQAGAALAPIIAGVGLAASLAGGWIGDRAAARAPAGRLATMAAAVALAIPLAAAEPLSADPRLALAGLAGFVFLTTAAIAVGPSAQQAMTPPAFRGVMSATGVLVVSVIGLGGGPLLVALATDHLLGDPQKLGAALALTTPVMLAVSALFALAGLASYDHAALAVAAHCSTPRTGCHPTARQRAD